MSNDETAFRCYKCKDEFSYDEIINDEPFDPDAVCPSCGWGGIHVIQRPSVELINALRTMLSE